MFTVVSRLHAGECDRCAILGENLKNNQDQNLRLIAKLSEFTHCSYYSTVRQNGDLLQLHKFCAGMYVTQTMNPNNCDNSLTIPLAQVKISVCPVLRFKTKNLQN